MEGILTTNPCVGNTLAFDLNLIWNSITTLEGMGFIVFACILIFYCVYFVSSNRR